MFDLVSKSISAQDIKERRRVMAFEGEEAAMGDICDFETPSKYERERSMMTLLYTKHLLKVLPEVIEEKYYDCQVSHPSQGDVFLMMSKKEQVETCLDTAIARLDQEEINSEYREKYPDVDEDTMASFFFFYEEWKNALAEIVTLLF
jgi:hypothetical protein